jgi:hypothetical protein
MRGSALFAPYYLLRILPQIGNPWRCLESDTSVYSPHATGRNQVAMSPWDFKKKEKKEEALANQGWTCCDKITYFFIETKTNI